MTIWGAACYNIPQNVGGRGVGRLAVSRHQLLRDFLQSIGVMPKWDLKARWKFSFEGKPHSSEISKDRRLVVISMPQAGSNLLVVSLAFPRMDVLYFRCRKGVA